MSFCKQNIEIGENDTVIMYMTFNEMRPTVIKRGSMFHSKYGSVKHVDLIGKKFGSRVVTNSGGRIYALQPTPELWTLCLPHRTQIIYTPNTSIITLELEIKPGSIVIESGTGSASLSHALVRTIFPTGHLHTFEFHSERADTARKEFQIHGMSDYVTVHNKDVCGEGFGLENVADAVFLDLPSPWNAVESAKAAIKKEGGRICSFSPCIEQVQKVALELTRLGFVDIVTVESLRRVLSVKRYEVPEFDFNMDMKKPVRVDNEPDDKTAENEDESGEAEKETADDEEANGMETSTTAAVVKTKSDSSKANDYNKKRKHSRSGEVNSYNEDDLMQFDDELCDRDKANSAAKGFTYTSKAINIQPGHTGFLTFATLLHKDY